MFFFAIRLHGVNPLDQIACMQLIIKNVSKQSHFVSCLG